MNGFSPELQKQLLQRQLSGGAAPITNQPPQAAQPTQPQQGKMTVEQFGQSIKAKYPQYQNISDAELGAKTLEKHPVYADRVDTGGQPQPVQTPPPPQEGLASKLGGAIVGLGKSIASPFVKAGVTGISAVHSAGDLLMGNQAGAEKALQGYDVPGFGHVAPMKIGTDVNDQMATHQGPFGMNTLKTLGTGAEIAATIGGGEGAVGLAEQGTKGALKQAAIQGLKEGAAVGATGGFGAEAQNDNVTPTSLLGSTALGAGIGGAIGGLTPFGAAAAKRLSGAFSGAETKAETVGLKKILEDTSPVLSAKERSAAIDAGRGVKGGLFTPSSISNDARDFERARAVSGIYDPKKDIYTNIANISKERTKLAEQTIVGLEQNDAIFNSNQFAKHLDRIEKAPQLTSDPILEKNYATAKEKFMSFVDEQPKKLSGLLQARKNFDAWVEKFYPNLYEDVRMTPLKQALKDMRNAGNDYIESRLPTGSPFRAQLRKQSMMYEAGENLAEKAAKTDLGKTGIQKFAKKHPLLKDAIKYAVGGTVGGELIRRGLD